MGEDIKYPEEKKVEEFGRLVRRMKKDREFVEGIVKQWMEKQAKEVEEDGN